jgi:glycosyltransferase involved in cell wall biosynthesis
MNLSICHYHLQRGGVTRIIYSQIAAVKEAGCIGGIQVLSGSEPEESQKTGFSVLTNRALNYLPQATTPEECRSIKDDLYGFIKGCVRTGDILHVHNPNLGKNPVLSYVLFLLSREGIRLFLHCHDFPEDRFPNSAFNSRILSFFDTQDRRTVEETGTLFPNSNRCFYGVLNYRDILRLKKKNIEPDRIRYLPNPVAFLEESLNLDHSQSKKKVAATLGISEEKPIFLYPVRVIRRKNIGEFILLASIFKDRASWLVTLAPHNPVERKFYDQWRAFNTEIGSPVVFEAGHKLGFALLMRAADRIITTSRQEGFGMSYLEPWLFGRPVVGRRIDYVVRDFSNNGMKFDCLYNRLPVETGEKQVDFADLEQKHQMSFIRSLIEGEKKHRELIESWELEKSLWAHIPEAVIQQNKNIVRETHSLKGYGKKLCTIYKELSQQA